jgi:hypothetical protein
MSQAQSRAGPGEPAYSTITTSRINHFRRVTSGFSGGWTSRIFLGKVLVPKRLQGKLAFLDIQTIVAKSGQPPIFPGVDLELILCGSALEQEVYERN